MDNAPAVPNRIKHQKTLWQKITKLTWITAQDLEMVEAYVIAVDLLDKCYEAVMKDGMVYEDSKGNPKTHPNAVMANTMLSRVKDLGSKLGLNTKDRETLKGTEQDVSFSEEWSDLA